MEGEVHWFQRSLLQNLEADVARFYGQPEARKSQGRRVHGGSNQPVKSPKLELGAFAVVQQKQGEKQQTGELISDLQAFSDLGLCRCGQAWRNSFLQNCAQERQ